jgi:hypothetical protein
MNALNPFSIYRRASVERWEVKDNKKKVGEGSLLALPP